jgi:hypothetical protein
MGAQKTFRIGSVEIIALDPADSAAWPSVYQQALADPQSRRALADLFEFVTGLYINGAASNPQDLRRVIGDRLDEAFRRGRLRILRQQFGRSSGSAFEEAEQIAARDLEAARQEARAREAVTRATEKTFIEIVLENQEGEPVRDALCHLTLTDGTVRKVRLDADGRVRVPGIDPGMCEVSFPEFDAGEWKQI